MNSCVFCLSSDSSLIFAKSEYFYAIYNRAPILSGHSLIIPKRHVIRFDELSDNELSEMLIFTKHVNTILTKAFGCNSFNWTIQDGLAAGQTINHLHLHIIPRKTGDFANPGDWYPKLEKWDSKVIDSQNRPQYTLDELKRISSHLSKI